MITGKDLEKAGLHWMPTLAGDKQMVLPVDEVMYQAQEVAAVIAEDSLPGGRRVTAVYVEYEPLQVVMDPFKALEPDAPVLRPGPRRRTRQNNHIWHWESGDRAATDAALAASDRVVPIDVYIPRIHVASIETCGCIADWDPVRGAPRLPRDQPGGACLPDGHQPRLGHPGVRQDPGQDARHRWRVRRQGAGLPGVRIAIVASLTLGRPVKWIEDRSREPPGRLVRPRLPHPRRARPEQRRQDHRPAGQDARGPRLQRRRGRPVQVPGRPVQRDHRLVRHADGVRRGRRRLHQQAAGRRRLPLLVPGDGGGPHDRAARRRWRARELGHGPGRVPVQELHPQEQFPYHTPTGWDYDSGDYPTALQKALDMIGYDDLRREQAEKRARGELMGIGISSFTEIVGAGPSHDFDLIGIKMFDSCEIRVHPTGSAIARLGVQTQGQGHETTFAQIIAEELGIPAAKIKIEEGDTDTAPYGLGTYASRSTPTAGAATADRRPQDPREGRQDRRPPAGGSRGRPRVDERQVDRQGLARTGSRRSRRSRSPPTRTTPTAWRPASRRPTTTTRRT